MRKVDSWKLTPSVLRCFLVFGDPSPAVIPVSRFKDHGRTPENLLFAIKNVTNVVDTSHVSYCMFCFFKSVTTADKEKEAPRT